MYWGLAIRIIRDSTSETMTSRRKCKKHIKVLKEGKKQPKNLYC